MASKGLLTRRMKPRAFALSLSERSPSLRCRVAAASSLLRSAASVNGSPFWKGSGNRGSSSSGLLCSAAPFVEARRWRSISAGDSFGNDGDGFIAEDSSGLDEELAHALEGEGNSPMSASLSQPLIKVDLQSPSARIRLEKIERPPGRFDLLTNSLVYRWQTTAAQARKVSGPMREWASELKYRTGVHLEVEPLNPERLSLAKEEGGYATADQVELNVYLFGTERGIFNCRQLMETALDQDPAYVRLAVFRRLPDKQNRAGQSAPPLPDENVEWLLLRRINRDLRPPDIPPISLKTPGKWTMLYEQYKEAAVRTLWEETGIAVEAGNVYPTAVLAQDDPLFYWRVPVHYFIAEVPYEVEVLGPQTAMNTYMHHWDTSLLRQSPDPIDRAWAQLADPETGCAWMKRPMIDVLQRPLRGDNYMALRYTPPPYSQLNDILGLPAPADAPLQGSSPPQEDLLRTAEASKATVPEDKTAVSSISEPSSNEQSS